MTQAMRCGVIIPGGTASGQLERAGPAGASGWAGEAADADRSASVVPGTVAPPLARPERVDTCHSSVGEVADGVGARHGSERIGQILMRVADESARRPA